MIGSGHRRAFLGVDAASKQLEDIAKPITAEDAEAATATAISTSTGSRARRLRRSSLEVGA